VVLTAKKEIVSSVCKTTNFILIVSVMIILIAIIRCCIVDLICSCVNLSSIFKITLRFYILFIFMCGYVDM